MSRDNLSMTKNMLIGFACGFLVSSISFMISRLIPLNNQFNAIAMLVGFSYLSVVGAWLGWRQRKIEAGAWCGVMCGGSYVLIGLYDVFIVKHPQELTLFIVYPGLLSGLLAVGLGKLRPLNLKQSLIRFLKGAFAGVVLGGLHLYLVFFFVFAIGRYFGVLFFIQPALGLGCASAVYFPLISWAVGLSSVKWIAKLTIWKVGMGLFVLMTLAGVLFPMLQQYLGIRL